MAQYFKDSKGAMHEFPDDATPQEIDTATRSLGTMAERYKAAGIDTSPSDPTTGSSFAQNALEAFGKSGVDTIEGVKQLFGGVTPQQVDERKRLDAPLMGTGGGLVGNIAGQAAQMAVPVGDAGKALSWAGKASPYIAAAVRGGAFNAVQGVGSDESRMGNATKGAALGAGGQAVAGAGAFAKAGLISKLKQPVRDLAQRATDMGMKLGIGQLSANPLVRTAISQMERLPFSGSTARNSANQNVVNQVAGGTIGANSTKLTPDVFAAAKSGVSDGFEVLTNRNDLTLAPKAVSAMNSLAGEASRLSGAGPIVKGWINELLSKADASGVIPGKAYQSIDSRLGQAMKGGGENALYLGHLRDLIRNEMDNSISAGDRNAWAAVRKQWAHIKTLEPLVGNQATGDISPAALMQRVNSNGAGKARMAVGNGGVLGDLAKIGQRFLKEAPNSGSADRMLVNGLVAGGLYGAQDRGYISPEHAAEVGAVLLGNRGLLKLLNSKALATGEGKAVNGLARLLKPAPKVLPALGNQGMAGLNIIGGTVAMPAQMAADSEIVRRFRQQQGR